MELGAVEILIFQRCAEHGRTITRGGYRVGAKRSIIRMDIIDVSATLNSLQQFRVEIVDAVPADMRDFQPIFVWETARSEERRVGKECRL